MILRKLIAIKNEYDYFKIKIYFINFIIIYNGIKYFEKSFKI